MLNVRLKLRNVIAVAICLAGSATMFAQETGVVINGVTWATRNVGAPGEFADKPEDGGMYYQWNSKVGWSLIDEELVPSDGTSVWNSEWDGNGATTWEPTNNPCPKGWRVPTETELESLLNSGYEWTTLPVNGGVFGNGENTIFLPATGAIWDNGIFQCYGSFGEYWSSTFKDLVFDENGTDYNVPPNRAFGLPVRCVKCGTTAINEVSTDTKNAAVTGYFDILGRKLKEEPKQGIYIILYDNGKTEKVMK